MLVKIVRRLTLKEVEERINRLKKEYGVSFSEFEELYLAGMLDGPSAEAYFEWSGLVHAYRGYLENGDLDYTVEETYQMNPEDLRIFTPKRLELLYRLSELRVNSINDLAHKVRRNVKNVYQDLKVLSAYGLVALKEKGKKSVVPESLVEEITFQMR